MHTCTNVTSNATLPPLRALADTSTGAGAGGVMRRATAVLAADDDVGAVSIDAMNAEPKASTAPSSSRIERTVDVHLTHACLCARICACACV
jgi:hypothetical protein